MNYRTYAVTSSEACLACGSKVVSIYFSKIFTRRVKILEKKKGDYRCERALWSDRVTPVNNTTYC